MALLLASNLESGAGKFQGAGKNGFISTKNLRTIYEECTIRVEGGQSPDIRNLHVLPPEVQVEASSC
jgi:hypothetical protein